MSEAEQERCPRCEASVHAGQEYCLECGGRLTHERPGPVERASMSVATRHPWAGAWLLPALLGLLIAVAGAGAAIAISGDGKEVAATSTATGGSLTVTEETPTLTAPEPTATTPTTTAPPPPATTAPAPPPVNPAVIAWPRERRGWTIVLLSLPQANGRAVAEAKAKEARQGGLRRVGVLNSSRYASLHPGYFVVFQGVYDGEPDASSSLQRARAVFPNAYQREIVP
ncbi:MAG: zinc ribbon domain-containing protein [Actinomycetota bacterium]|nr:zinc ribbon domain-containing protein [Actinomycetota bacterium]